MKIDETLNSGDDEKIEQLAKEIKYYYGLKTNHELFWQGLAPMAAGGGLTPESDSSLGKAIEKSFDSFNAFFFKFCQ